MGTEVNYNGVILGNVQTLAFNQEVIYDESDTDVMYSRFTIRVESLAQSISASYTGAEHRAYPVGGNQPTAVASMSALEAQLMHPRGAFSYVVGGNTLVQANDIASSPHRDVDNGPKPRMVNITHVAGENVFRVEFEIEVCVVLCGSVDLGNGDGFGAVAHANVLNNRWTLTDTMDSNFYWTRRWEGDLRVAHRSVNPQAVRYLVIPPLLDGYKRESFRFTTPKNALFLRYEITDVQKNASAPHPATDWDATYVESASQGGGKGHAELSVSLIGPPGPLVKRALLIRAIQVAEARLGDLKRLFGKGAKGVYLNNAAIVEHMSVNRVDVQMRVMHYQPELSKYYGMLLGTIGTPLDADQPSGLGTKIPNYNHRRFMNPLIYDSTSPLSVFANYVQSPCDPIHGIPQVFPLDPEKPDTAAHKKKAKEPIYETPEEPDNQNEDELEDLDGNFYTYVAVDSEYRTHRGIYQLPIGQDDATLNSAKHVRMHQPVTKRIVTVDAERVGSPPELPEPSSTLTEPSGIKAFLLEDRVKFQAPDVGADGKVLIYRASIELEYGLEKAPKNSDKWSMGAVPYLKTAAADNYFDGSKLFKSKKYQVGDDKESPGTGS